MSQQRTDRRKATNYLGPHPPYLDLLQAAWQFTDSEMERFANLPSGFMWRWRNHYAVINEDERRTVERLSSFHDALRLVVAVGEGDPGPPPYGEYLRSRWSEGSLIGSRSILEAVIEDGSSVIDLLIQYFWAQQ